MLPTNDQSSNGTGQAISLPVNCSNSNSFLQTCCEIIISSKKLPVISTKTIKVAPMSYAVLWVLTFLVVSLVIRCGMALQEKHLTLSLGCQCFPEVCVCVSVCAIVQYVLYTRRWY